MMCIINDASLFIFKQCLYGLDGKAWHYNHEGGGVDSTPLHNIYDSQDKLFHL